MNQISESIIVRNTIIAIVITIIIVMIGTLSRELYLKIINPSDNWVMKSDVDPLTLALGIGIGAGVTEVLISYLGLRVKK